MRAAVPPARRRPVAPGTRRGLHGADARRAGGLRGGTRPRRGARPGRDPPLHRQPHRVGQRPARSAAAAKGGRAPDRYARRSGERGADRRAAVRDDRRSAPGERDHACVLRAARYRRARAAQRRRAGRDARLQRQQQGRRLLHEPLGAVSRRAGAGRTVRAARGVARHPAAPLPWSRRRAELRGDPRAAAGHGQRPAPAHRTGRSHRVEVRASRDRAAQPRNPGRCDARSNAVARRAAAPGGRGAAEFVDAAARISEASSVAYRALVYDTPGFADYFFAATPIREIAALDVGSRPASRKATRAIEDLRAIPWTFSWGQRRIALPGWYGFGLGVEAFLGQGAPRDERLALLRRMHQRWPFFRTLL